MNIHIDNEYGIHGAPYIMKQFDYGHDFKLLMISH